MYCHHCGAELPDSANFCTECGTKIIRKGNPEPRPVRETSPEPDRPGTLLITRRHAVLNGIKTQVFVDGVLRDKIGEGDSAIIELPAGPHKLRLTTSGTGKKEDTFFIDPGETTIYKFELSIVNAGGHKIICNGREGTQQAQPRPSTLDRLVNEPQVMPNGERRCPHCGGLMIPQTVSESKKAGCFTVILYILLCLTILGILIVIPLALRKKTETVTYMVCQQCGRKQRLYSSV